MKTNIGMKGLRGIGGNANTLGYENKVKYEGPPRYWRHRQYVLDTEVEIHSRPPPAIGGTANTLEYKCTIIIQIELSIQ
jgi:hypothetical protein